MSTDIQPRHVVGIDLGTTHTVVAHASVDGGDVVDEAVVQLVAAGEYAPRAQLASSVYLVGAGELPPASTRLPWTRDVDDPVHVLGALARAQGARVPGRVVVSAKSWLSVAGVDRTAAILPWGAGDDVPRVSPVDVATRILTHVRESWDHAHPDAPLHAQDVTVTVPASFDEVARELTLQAASNAGLPHVRLLEEPQAALYDFLHAHDRALKKTLAGIRLVLVVDVGGGTTDLTLVAVEPATKGPPKLTRIAVGEHLMLGGDNMDITLARHVEQELLGSVGALDGASWSTLVESSRAAKEALLSSSPPDEVGVSIVSRGSKLVGGTRTSKQPRAVVESLLLDGFFPRIKASDVVEKRPRAALTAFGLPYAQDTAIPRHVLAFLRRHAAAAMETGVPVVDGVPKPDAILLNGGVFNSPRVCERFLEIVASWFGEAVPTLAHGSLDSAVARGAAYAGLVRRGHGIRIGGGSARAYFVGISDDAGVQQALCIAPHGMPEGSDLDVNRTFRLVLGKPVSFPLFTSTSEHAPAGALVDTSELERMPPIHTVLTADAEVPVRLHTRLHETGQLELSLQMTPEALRAWRLNISLRTEASVVVDESVAGDALPKSEGANKRTEEAKDLVLAYFGNKSKDIDPKNVKNLRRDLEKLLGARESWSVGQNREIFGALMTGAARRRRSVEHERAFFQLAGFCLRPGVGAPFDDWRVTELWKLWPEGVQHISEKPTWASWWVLWRRVAAGLSSSQQVEMADYLEPWLVNAGTGIKGRGPTPHGTDEMIRLLASLERLPAARKTELGSFVLKKLARGGLTSWWPLGRLGARQLLAGSAHDVVPPAVVAIWLERVLAQPLESAEGASFALAQMAAVTGDRARDLDATLRNTVASRLERAGAKPSWVRMVRELVPLSSDDEAAAFGDSLPVGLKLGA
jgi:molecular chaperone DnaK (HSP70)